jgi:Flp pilus assembly protein TadG
MTQDRGSTTGELVVLIPLLMMIVLVIVYVGRVTQTAIVLQQVVDVAARDASLASRRSVSQVAIASSQRELVRNDVYCTRANIRTRISQMGNQSTINVQLSCQVSLRDMSLLNLSSITLRADSTSVIDRFRGE